MCIRPGAPTGGSGRLDQLLRLSGHSTACRWPLELKDLDAQEAIFRWVSQSGR